MERKTILVLTIFAIIIFINSLFALSTQPSFCGICHRGDYKTWAKSSHKEIKCNFCHQKAGVLGFSAQRVKLLRMTVAYSTGFYKRPVTTTVSIEVCLSCHNKILEERLVKNALVVSHTEFVREGYNCGYCHSMVPHKEAVPSPRTTNMDRCLECHDGELARAECNICHQENARRRRVSYKGPWRVTHGRSWRSTHGMGNLRTCNVCHSRSYCARCHQIDLPHPASWGRLHGKTAIQFRESCYACHNKSICESCHQVPMPHQEKFLPDHPRIVKEDGNAVCLRCHIKAGCDACHERHIHRAVLWFEGRPGR